MTSAILAVLLALQVGQGKQVPMGRQICGHNSCPVGHYLVFADEESNGSGKFVCTPTPHRPRPQDLMPLVEPLRPQRFSHNGCVNCTSVTFKPSVVPPHHTAQTFHHCTFVGGSGNSPHLFDVSEIYQCDEGKIEIAGQWTQAIEYGYVFTEQLGRSAGDPHKVTASDYKDSKWCSTPTPWDANYKKRCGDKPTKCWDGKMGTWDPNWQGYSCVTSDH